MTYEDAKVPHEIWDGKFVFKQLIGYGGQGTVCVYTEKATNIDHAVKFDAIGQNSVLNECLFLRDFSEKIEMVPKYKYHNTIGGRRFLIMNYLKNSVFEHITEQLEKKVKQEDIFRDIALQMFDGI